MEKILIVDDSKMNMLILDKALSKEYDLVKESTLMGAFKAVRELRDELRGLIVNSTTSSFSGLDFLKTLQVEKLYKSMPVFLVVGNEQISEHGEKLYEYGITDYIFRPFKPEMVLQKVKNQVEIFAAKRELEKQLGRQKTTLQSQYLMLQKQAEKLKGNNEKILDVLGTIVEYRNIEGSRHIENVKNYTNIIAHQMLQLYPEYGLTENTIRIIVSASALHDVGKILIPDSILLKPAKLTDDEYKYMCSHTLRGYDLIESIKGAWNEEYSKYSKEIARSHHERYDGKGYPENLVGDDIPVSAQLVGVADCLDALLTDRVYKAAVPFEEAFLMILQGDCGTFSPKILECMRHAREELENYYNGIKSENQKLD